MATKNEKIFGSIVGFGIGLCLAPKSANSQDNLTSSILNGLVYGALGYGASLILGEPNDTVNYKLFKGRKLVYHGITYEERTSKRSNEHKKSGKVFSRMKFDQPKPRSEATKLERKLILKDRPEYNIQHNSK